MRLVAILIEVWHVLCIINYIVTMIAMCLVISSCYLFRKLQSSARLSLKCRVTTKPILALAVSLADGVLHTRFSILPLSYLLMFGLGCCDAIVTITSQI